MPLLPQDTLQAGFTRYLCFHHLNISLLGHLHPCWNFTLNLLKYGGKYVGIISRIRIVSFDFYNAAGSILTLAISNIVLQNIHFIHVIWTVVFSKTTITSYLFSKFFHQELHPWFGLVSWNCLVRLKAVNFLFYCFYISHPFILLLLIQKH